ncbi:MAG: choice-of-anchor tandem repeat GloVer-containing protein [Terriglobia bacterium]
MKPTLILLLGLWLATTALAQIPVPTPNQTPVVTQQFAFRCGDMGTEKCPDGSRPAALIQASDGSFYGTAQVSEEGVSNPHGGTIFKLTPGSQFTLLFTFAPGKNESFPNGDAPGASLVEGKDGFLYGTTFAGGADNAGIIFKISKKGTFQVLHSFCSLGGCADGSGPVGLILGDDGNFYGATHSGGSSVPPCGATAGCGTLFRITRGGLLSTLHALNGVIEGSQPLGLIQASDGNFYGADIGDNADGNVFRLTPGGQFTILHAFPSLQTPISGLVQGANGNLYGIFATYGTNQEQTFEIGLSGSGFQTFPPFARLAGVLGVPSLVLASDGNLWGTTFEGGVSGDGGVFALSRKGAVPLSFSFDGANGSLPLAPVIQGADGKIYGTATRGGTDLRGHLAAGTVWALDAALPPPAPAIATVTPSSGQTASKVTIRGTHFIGTTAVSFNGTNALFTVLNVNFIIATVPPGGTTGPVTVTNAGGTATSQQEFTVE